MSQNQQSYHGTKCYSNAETFFANPEEWFLLACSNVSNSVVHK